MAVEFGNESEELLENAETLDAQDSLENTETNENDSNESNNLGDPSLDDSPEDTENEELNQDNENVKVSRNKLKFDEIEVDDSLPIIGTESQDELNFQQKFLSMHDKNLDKLGKAKSHTLTILVSIILIVGTILVIVNLNKGEIVTDNTLVFELPSVSTVIFSEDGSQSFNVKVDLSVGIKSSDSKNFNMEACYNVVYDIISNMTYEQFDNVEAQYIIKEEVIKEFAKRTNNEVEIKIYVSDLEVLSASTQTK